VTEKKEVLLKEAVKQLLTAARADLDVSGGPLAQARGCCAHRNAKVRNGIRLFLDKRTGFATECC
jgi:hypothetical protein